MGLRDDMVPYGVCDLSKRFAGSGRRVKRPAIGPAWKRLRCGPWADPLVMLAAMR